ncbi:replicative DNA helicase [Halobacillus dabanensis]|uniref:Replicative DNA helicase n=1 Tax=Halobacillus dabanensis TaxID=240302 RepID=A0A1I3QBT3_HALDA|nr:replicative DNA helicase [Halobacillus dabanensis]SFJ31754.1 replicative DNA helicase [Halobacillus dabanensis]
MSHNLQTEQALLGIFLVDGEKIKQTSLEPIHFSEREHRRIFSAIQQVDNNGTPVDMVTVTTSLGQEISDVGGVSYLLALAESVPTTENFHVYEKLLIESYTYQRMRQSAMKYIENPSADALLGLKQQLHLMDKDKEADEQTVKEQLSEIAMEMTSSPGQTGFSTGFVDYDKMTGGAQRGDLIIVAARPSMGKTAFALNIARNHCKNRGAVDLFSLEMGSKQLLQRMISSEARIDGQKWRSMCFSTDDYKRSFNIIGEIAEWNLSIHEREQSVQDITSKIRASVVNDPNHEHLIIIDYLQLMSVKGRYERRDLEVGAITRELKLLARELNIPIILLSQLSRSVEQRQDKRPMMSDLRESGNIEQDADVISFLYRDDYYSQEGSDGVEVILRKQRNGPVGTVMLGFEKEFGRFVDLM